MTKNNLLDGRLKIRHLILVTTIAEQGTILRAAEHMHITQPVVTRSLQEIERILGAELFTRGPRGVTPTIYGDVLIEHAYSVIGQITSAGETIARLSRADAGTVTVGTHLAGANILLPKAIAELIKRHPQITVIVREATPDILLSSLLRGELDLTVGRISVVGGSPSTTQIGLYDEPIRLVTRTGHPVLDAELPSLADLQAFPWVLPATQTRLRQEVQKVFADEGLGLPEAYVESSSFLMVRNLLLETDAIAVLPELVVRYDRDLALLETGLPTIQRTVGVTIPSDRRLQPGANLLLQSLRRVARSMS